MKQASCLDSASSRTSIGPFILWPQVGRYCCWTVAPQLSLYRLLLPFISGMKLIRLSILFSLISAIGVQKVNAQAFKAEIIGGTNISQVDGDEVFGFLKYGVNMGLGVVMPIHKNWSLSFETLYTQKGSRLGKVYSDSLDGSYKLHLNYAEVPFLIQYTDRDRASAGIGFSWGRLVAVNEWKNG